MECRRCDRRFASKQALSYHKTNKVCLKSVRKDKSCQYCKKVFSSVQMAVVHETRGVCKKADLTCEKCNKTFAVKHTWEYHTKNEVCARAAAMRKCDNCGKAFSSPQRLKYHIEHAVCEDQCCPLCDLKYSDPWHQNRCDEYVDWGCDGEMPSYRVKAHVQTKKELDALCYNFDEKEGRPWSDYLYWRKRCKECGYGRASKGHMECLNRE